ncbi:MAG: HD domain-containing protein [Patescibacteria group bacterium]
MLPNTELMRAVRMFAEHIATLPPNPDYSSLPPRAYLVGGAVRDILLGRESKDADMEVYGVSAERLHETLESLYPGCVNTIGKQFAVLHITLREGMGIDVALPRREIKTGEGHTDFDIAGDPMMTVEEAARRRDFTINAILIDPLTGDMIDPYDGAIDVKKHILRVVDEKTFIEDPLRVYRAVQFVARFHLTVEKTTKNLLKRMVEQGELDHLPKERVTEELRKLFTKSEMPSLGLECAKELGIIDREYPELARLESTDQDPAWHPEGNVWIHTLMSIDVATEIIRDPSREFSDEHKRHIVLATLCHDLGKPETTEYINEHLRARGHEAAGEAPTRALLSRWSFSDADTEATVRLVIDHLKPAELVQEYEKGRMDERAFGNALRRLMKRLQPATLQELLAVYESDSRGRTGHAIKRKAHADTIRETIFRTLESQQIDEASLKPLLSGSDLIALGLEPGIQFGELIHAVEALRDEGKISTKEEALKFVHEEIKESD